MSTTVIFRKDRYSGQVIAFMPNIVADNNGNFTCYTRETGHCAYTSAYAKTTVRAAPSEYRALKRHLEVMAYAITVRPYSWVVARWQEQGKRHSDAAQRRSDARYAKIFARRGS